MKFEELLNISSGEPVFETGLLLAGDVKPADVRKQLSRWVSTGKIYKLRRGLYALAPPHLKVKPHPFLVANRLVPASYVSLQSALAYYGLIPEYVPVTTSVTTWRAGRWDTPLGVFLYRHFQKSNLTGYRLIDLGDGQHALLATPEKALLDLIYLTPGGDSPDFLTGLRLQNLDSLNLKGMRDLTARLGSKKLVRAVERIASAVSLESKEYEPL